ncbi:hypothetical protein VNO77_18762 [Canavalia gladiata]|uniref:Uncharacterized protein n=1 Tax=Canavalia gladiata TaxID=3824 RepID=A0AAN9QJX9_CANGL
MVCSEDLLAGLVRRFGICPESVTGLWTTKPNIDYGFMPHLSWCIPRCSETVKYDSVTHALSPEPVHRPKHLGQIPVAISRTIHLPLSMHIFAVSTYQAYWAVPTERLQLYVSRFTKPINKRMSSGLCSVIPATSASSPLFLSTHVLAFLKAMAWSDFTGCLTSLVHQLDYCYRLVRLSEISTDSAEAPNWESSPYSARNLIIFPIGTVTRIGTNNFSRYFENWRKVPNLMPWPNRLMNAGQNNAQVVQLLAGDLKIRTYGVLIYYLFKSTHSTDRDSLLLCLGTDITNHIQT